MISPIELKEFLGTAGADFSEQQLELSISRAIERFKKLIGREPDFQNPQEHKALLLLAIIDLATVVNLYYRKEGGEIIRVKDLVAEVEYLLNLTQKGAIVWQKI
ncbi:MAG: hypothetical protein QXX12_01750 [Nanopusillaceae archaeon]